MNKYFKSHNLSQYSQSCQAKTLICSVLPIHSFIHSFSFIHWLLMLLTPVFAVKLVPTIIHPWPVSTTYIHDPSVLLTSITRQYYLHPWPIQYHLHPWPNQYHLHPWPTQYNFWVAYIHPSLWSVESWSLDTTIESPIEKSPLQSGPSCSNQLLSIRYKEWNKTEKNLATIIF